MRILVAHNYYQHVGGEDTTFHAEVGLLRRYGHDVIEFTEDNDEIKSMTGYAVAINTLWSNPTYQRLMHLLHETHPDIIHFHNTFPLISPAAYYACHNYGIPVIQTIQNYRLLCPAATLLRNGKVCELCLQRFFPWPSIRYRCYHDSYLHTGVIASMLATHRLLRTWQRQVNIYILLTDFPRQKFIQAGFPPEKLVVKPNTLYPDPGSKTELGDFALFVGRLSIRKGNRNVVAGLGNASRYSVENNRCRSISK